MSQCYRCDRLYGSHEPECPHDKSKDSPEQQIWQRGYSDGRTGRNKSQPTQTKNAIYMMGWLRGNVALETFENEHQS